MTCTPRKPRQSTTPLRPRNRAPGRDRERGPSSRAKPSSRAQRRFQNCARGSGARRRCVPRDDGAGSDELVTSAACLRRGRAWVSRRGRPGFFLLSPVNARQPARGDDCRIAPAAHLGLWSNAPAPCPARLWPVSRAHRQIAPPLCIAPIRSRQFFDNRLLCAVSIHCAVEITLRLENVANLFVATA